MTKIQKLTNFFTEKMTQDLKKFLIDTHIFIWAMDNSPRLTKIIKDLISNPKNEVYLSVVSIWEIMIKRSSGNLKTPAKIIEGIKAAGFDILPIEAEHALALEQLPDYHKDPFDRMLIAQARSENMVLITSDSKIWKYGQKILKA